MFVFHQLFDVFDVFFVWFIQAYSEKAENV